MKNLRANCTFVHKGALPDDSLMIFGQLMLTNPSSKGWIRPAGRISPILRGTGQADCVASLGLEENSLGH